MSKLSDLLKENSGVPQKYKDSFGKCIFCGEKIEKGGGWQCAGLEIGVCENDAHFLIDLYIDAMTDIGAYSNMDFEKKKQSIFAEVEKRIEKKEKIDMRNATRKAFEELGMNYFGEFSPIDFWALSMSKEELVMKLKEEALEYEGGNSTDKSQYVDICEDTIIRVVEKVSGEKPHTIRYFTVPDVESFDFSIGCVDKIDNNGTTYIFLNDRNVLENMNPDGFGDIKNTLNEI